ncbi:MAG: glycosyltransferase [Chitinophagales bacterium]|nr:glycosyltransferase [Chitinophagales bacterium]MDW8427689.1 glycosyltransferase [Chitinophagales bacterium]
MAKEKKAASAPPLRKLSLIIPCYNEALRFSRLEQELQQFAAKAPFDFEIILVNDGSTDRTAQCVAESAWLQQLQQQGRFIYIELDHNQGKGAALKLGAAKASGSHLLTLDADMAASPLTLLHWLEHYPQCFEKPQILIGSREHPLSQVTDSTGRRLAGRIFNLFIRLIAALPLRDTQCGFKLYPAAIGQFLFRRLYNCGWAHDIELLLRARQYGFAIHELPLHWQAVPGSKIVVWRHMIPMFWALLTITLRLRWEYFVTEPLQVLRRQSFPEFAQPQQAPFRLAFFSLSAFLLFLMAALSFDYGITGDDLDQKIYGEAVLDFYTTWGRDTSCLHVKVGNKDNLYLYGGLFNMISAAANRYIGGLDEYDMRHLINSISGWAAIVFTGLLAHRLGGWLAAVLALVLLASWPQFFGHSMNNPKDIPFALGYVWSIYYLVKMVAEVPRVTLRTWMMLTLAIAFTINIRVGGLVLLGMLLAFAGGAYVLMPEVRRAFYTEKSYIPFLRNLLVVMIVAYFGGLLFWPYGLLNPFSHPFIALREMTNFSMGIRVLFEGRHLMSDEIPWYYIPKWIGITTPLVVLFGFALSPLLLLRRTQARPLLVLVAFALIFPWAYTVYKSSALYDGLRQMLFLLPLIAVFAALSWQWLWNAARRPALRFAAILGFSVGLFLPLRFCVANHPNQYVYFNELIGGIRGAYGRYDTDYYMNSIRKTSEWLRHSSYFQQASAQRKLLIATNAVDPVNWYFRNDTDKVHIVFTKWHAPGNPKTRGARDWDVGIYFSRDVDASQLKSGAWPSRKAVYLNTADGVPLSAVIERGGKSDLLGYQAMQRNDWTEALRYLEQALEENPQNEDAALWLAQTYLHMGRFAEALRTAQHYLSLFPTSPHGLITAGSAAASAGNTQQAIAYLQKATMLSPYNPQPYYLLALIYQQAGDAQAAQRFMSRYRQLSR